MDTRGEGGRKSARGSGLDCAMMDARFRELRAAPDRRASALRSCCVAVQVGLLGLSLGLASCTVDANATGAKFGGRGQSGVGRQNASTGDIAGTATEAAFEPIRLRVHPLTHLDVEDASGGKSDAGKKSGVSGSGAGSATLVLHYELRDQFTDPVKGLGVLRVEASKRGVGSGGVAAGETATWDVADLADPTINSRRFDPATRTYRISLTTPEWLRAWANAEGAETRATVVLKVTLVTPRSDGTRRMLTDEFVMER